MEFKKELSEPLLRKEYYQLFKNNLNLCQKKINYNFYFEKNKNIFLTKTKCY